jgi:hypothetical protein
VLGFAPTAALPVAALDFAAATVLPVYGPLWVLARVVAAGVESGRVVAAGVTEGRVVSAGVAEARWPPPGG